jgi:benzylsuccinate CoA-transferase BbsE subunit
MGADVIKVEPPGGSSTRNRGYHPELLFGYFNAGKQSVTLPYDGMGASPELARLLAGADVALVSGEAWRLDGYGINPEALSEANPRLVVAVVTPFGREEPYRAFRGEDLVTFALSGILNTCGYDDLSIPPVKPGGGQAYNVAGVFAAHGILLALIERDSSGLGQVVDVSAQAAMCCSTENSNVWWMYMQQTFRRQMARHAAPALSQASIYLCGDGRYLSGGPPRGPGQGWSDWLAMLQADGMAEDLGEERFQDPQVRQQEARHINQVWARYCLTRNADDLYHWGQAHDTTWAAVRRPEDMLHDAQLHAREFFVTGEDGLPYPGSPIKLSRTPWAHKPHVPAPGEHTREVLGA